MAIEITHVRFANPEHKTHDTITRLKWKNVEKRSTGDRDLESMVTWLGFPSNTAYVGTGSNRRYLAVVGAEDGPAHIRAHHDDAGWSDDLLELPQF